MISAASNFEESIQYLVNTMVMPPQKGMTYQSNAMNSDTYNDTMKAVEKQLDTLYEKTRILQDVIDYSKQYVESNIYDILSECKNIFGEITVKRDSIDNRGYIDYDVPFKESVGAYTDRDGTSLSHCSINMGSVTLSGQEINTIKYDTISKQSVYIPYTNNINDLKAGNKYRSLYLLDLPPSGGIVEVITLGFNNPTLMNYIEFITSRCDVVQVNYIYANGVKESSTDIIGSAIKDRAVKSIELIIVSVPYDNKSYTYNADAITANFWDIQANDYLNSQNAATELEALTQINSAQEDFITYQNELLYRWNRVY